MNTTEGSKFLFRFVDINGFGKGLDRSKIRVYASFYGSRIRGANTGQGLEGKGYATHTLVSKKYLKPCDSSDFNSSEFER